MLRVQSSRRAGALKPGDYDHEIFLVDHDGATSLQPVSLTQTDSGEMSRLPTVSESGDIQRVSTTSPLLPAAEERPEDNGIPASTLDQDSHVRMQERPVGELRHEQRLPHAALRPSIEIQEPTPDAFHGDTEQVVPPKPHVERETAFDILYENERGGFLCGTALFSSKALGGLDHTPWTNVYHKPSPTSIHTATVPDPSWEWIWPEWHINHQDGLDEGGWEYSFAFSKKFSWHNGKWWNSFVRRRAWVRKRAKRPEGDISADFHMLNTDYFFIKPASERRHRSTKSLSSSRVPSKTSMTQVSSVEVSEQNPDIEDIETLIQTLRRARIDREKLDAVENYLEHAIDLSLLQEEMHEIMSLFVFQASRRLLLSKLIHLFDETTEEVDKRGAPDLKSRQEALQAAIKHADEEVRRLAYWSDVKQMADEGESRGAVDSEKGWHGDWQGLDQSGPTQPNSGKLPGP